MPIPNLPTSKLLSFVTWPKRLGRFLQVTAVWTWQTLTFTFLLNAYLLYIFVNKIMRIKFIPGFIRIPVTTFSKLLLSRLSFVSRKQERTINRINLIDMALRNMLFKRSRAIITVGGMAIGVGAIVFLVSIGFGLQELVIRRVARLDELKQTEVTTMPGSREKIDDATLANITSLEEVDQVLPLIATVARVNFQNSVSDMAVYGVTTDFLKSSAIQPTKGTIFDSNELSIDQDKRPSVAGYATEAGVEEFWESPDSKLVADFSIDDQAWVKIRSHPATNSEVLGYARRGIGKQQGNLVWGSMYPEARSQSKLTLLSGGQQYGQWIEGQFMLWTQTNCDPDSNPNCMEGYEKKLGEDGQQLLATGYTAQSNVSLVNSPLREVRSQVLGDTTEIDTDLTTADLNASDSAVASLDAGISDAGEGWVEIASESASTNNTKTTTVSLAGTAKKVAVVNRAMLNILGMNENEAVGKSFQTSYVVVGDLLEAESNEKIESVPAEYTIVGVVPEDKAPFFYVPFTDLRGLGVRNYSQVKVVVASSDTLSLVRKKIEASGFATSSVADTVKQIDRLFASARIALLIVGMVALAIAALGMFNTLTVSLLERTREVGLMKAMGMKSHEVRELFLTESLVMGFFGGILGIILGFSSGKLLGLILSLFSVTKGAGYIDVAFLPLSFVIFIFVLSLVVGVFTGVYPAIRATKISALNALRYE